MPRSMFQLAVDNHVLVSLLGGLLIFFSWVVSNTLERRYERAAELVSSIQSDHSTDVSRHQVQTRLSQIEEMLRLIVNELSVEKSREIEGEQIGFSSPPIMWQELFSNYVQQRQSGGQIDDVFEANRFNQRLLEIVAPTSTASQRTRELGMKIERVKLAALEHQSKIDEILIAQFSEENVSRLQNETLAFERFLEAELPDVQELMFETTEIANETANLADTHLARLKWLRDISMWLALGAYAIGTVFVILGGAVEKKLIS